MVCYLHGVHLTNKTNFIITACLCVSVHKIDNLLIENSINNITVVGDMVDMLYDAGYRVN